MLNQNVTRSEKYGLKFGSMALRFITLQKRRRQNKSNKKNLSKLFLGFIGCAGR